MINSYFSNLKKVPWVDKTISFILFPHFCPWRFYVYYSSIDLNKVQKPLALLKSNLMLNLRGEKRWVYRYIQVTMFLMNRMGYQMVDNVIVGRIYPLGKKKYNAMVFSGYEIFFSVSWSVT